MVQSVKYNVSEYYYYIIFSRHVEHFGGKAILWVWYTDNLLLNISLSPSYYFPIGNEFREIYTTKKIYFMPVNVNTLLYIYIGIYVQCVD